MNGHLSILGEGLKQWRDEEYQMDYIAEISEADAATTYPVIRRVFEGRTAVGTDTIIADSPVYGRMLFLDGELQSAAADEHVYHETLVHPVMAMALRNRCRVLVIGGGEGATVREVLRWPDLGRVDWVDYDSDLVTLCREHLGWGSPEVYDATKVRYRAADIGEAWPALADAYDVIILDLPDPDGDTGYLYSPQFWEDVKTHLAPTGFLVTHCGPVRPFGIIGEGFLRVRQALGDQPAGFYAQPIASFQGDWGFWLWSAAGGNPFAGATGRLNAPTPVGLRVADSAQIRVWGERPRVWRTASAIQLRID